MKKALAILCVMTLCLGVASAVAAEYTVPELFTVTYDDTLLQAEGAEYMVDEPTEAGQTWLFRLHNDEIVFEAETEAFDNEFADITLATASPEEQQAYIDYFLDTYASEDARYNETILTDKEQVPFCLFTLADEEGDYYYAETIVDGLGIGFYGYYSELDKAPDDVLDDLFFSFLKSFALVK